MQDIDNNDEFDFSIKIDLEDIKNNIDKYSSQKICDMIICQKYLSFNKEIQVFCMEELGKRRLQGEKFNYEDYIESNLKDLPKIDLNIPDLRSLLKDVLK